MTRREAVLIALGLIAFYLFVYFVFVQNLTEDRPW